MVHQWSRWVVISVALCFSSGGYTAQGHGDSTYAEELQEFVAKLAEVVMMSLDLDLVEPNKHTGNDKNTLTLLQPNTVVSDQCDTFRPYQTLSQAFEQDLIYLERLDEPYDQLLYDNSILSSVVRNQTRTSSRELTIRQDFIPTLKLALNIKDNALSLTFYSSEDTFQVIEEHFLFDRHFHHSRFNQFDHIKLTQRKDIPEEVKRQCHFYNLSDDQSVYALKKVVQTIDAELTTVLDYFFQFESDPKLFVDALKASQQLLISTNKRTAHIHSDR